MTANVLVQTGSFLLIILLGFFMKRLHILARKDADVLGKIIMNLTMPCLFLSGANGIQRNGSFALLLFTGVF